jgi:hypothetical protein
MRCNLPGPVQGNGPESHTCPHTRGVQISNPFSPGAPARGPNILTVQLQYLPRDISACRVWSSSNIVLDLGYSGLTYCSSFESFDSLTDDDLRLKMKFQLKNGSFQPTGPVLIKERIVL